MLPINIAAIIVAAVINMALGFLWYSPVLFAKPWMKAMGLDKKKLDDMKKTMGPKYGLSLVAAFVVAFVLAWFIKTLGVDTFLGGVRIGFFAWLGFATTVQLTDHIFSDKPKVLYFINTAYQLASYCLMGGIIALWR